MGRNKKQRGPMCPAPVRVVAPAAGDSRPCTHAVAIEMADHSRVVVERLLGVSDLAQRAGEGWPDAPATSELRTLLLDVVEAAEAHARRWNDLARRLEALGMDGA